MESTGETWRLGHRPALDGLRGVAILLVLAAHSTELYWPGVWGRLGGVGVTMFFTLSGFLITALLLEERARTGRISLTGFYARRARRLLPALLAVLVVVVALRVVHWQAVGAVLLYVGNWYGAAGYEFAWLNHTWSLAIEEQFYLLWPLVVTPFRSRRALLSAALAGSLSSIVCRVVLWDGSLRTAEQITWWTHTRADALLIGCALAAALHGAPTQSTRARAVAPLLLGTVAVALVGGAHWTVVWLPFAVASLTAAVLWLLVRDGGSWPWLSRGPIAWLGKRSYGVYLWHIPVMNICLAFAMPPTLYVTFAVLGSLLVASLSWRFIERPVLDRRTLVVADSPVAGAALL